jgi:ligand-binding sensor domain-containing protein
MFLPTCLALLAVANPALAQEGGRRPFTVLGPDQGMPAGGAIALAQDLDGFIWIGTEKGLVRYDGGQCRTWSKADGLPSAWVPRIVPARDGGLWVATLAGLMRLKDGRLDRATLGSTSSDMPATLVALDGRGRPWVATNRGLFVQKDGLVFEQLPWKPATRTFAFVSGARSGSMYLAGETGIQEFLADGSSRSWGPAEGLPAGGPVIVVEDGAGRVWAGTGRTLVAKEVGAARFADQSHHLPASLSANGVPLVDRDGTVWLPTQGGALHLLGGDRTELLDAAGGLPFRWVRTVFRDREGTLWVLGPSLARLQGNGRVWNFTLSREATGEVVWFVARDREGRLFVATDDGAARMGPGGLERIPGTEGRRVKALAVDRAGTLWMASTVGPTMWLRRGAPSAIEAPLGEFGQSANTVMADSAGRVWVGHVRHGILRWDAETRRLVQEVGPDFTQTATLGAARIAEDASGRLWAGTSAGLLVREVDGRWRVFTDKDGLRARWVRGMAFLADGSAWVHYQEPVGLSRVRVDGGRLTVLEQRTAGASLRSDLVYAVQVDPRGQVWATTEQGLDRLDPPLHIGRRDGMVSEDCAVQALLADEDRVWVGTAGGLVAYDTGQPDGPPPFPKVHVLQMTYGRERLESPFGTVAPIPFRDASVEFRVASPYYANERDLRFQVRLTGLEPEWRDTTSRAVYYPALSGGRYTFEARAAFGGAEFGPITSVDFVVRPPWWRTWWAYALAMVGGVGAVTALVSLRERSIARGRAALEALVNTRTAELQARNEELSVALGRVKQLSGLLPICAHCKKLRDDQGYWRQLETYITQHTDAQFSHSICPDCMKARYPDFQ